MLLCLSPRSLRFIIRPSTIEAIVNDQEVNPWTAGSFCLESDVLRASPR